MATRMGSVVKALVEIKPGYTFLDARLAEQRALSARAGRPVPLWLMTSDATDAPIRRALAERGAPPEVATFRQGMALRLAPNGSLFRDKSGVPSTYATGHGDLVDALRGAGLLDKFRADGGEALLIANLDNLGASLDLAYAGALLESDAQLLVEVCRKQAGDRGGIPVEHDGRVQVLEEFRLPTDFDAATVQVFNTNTMWVRADALATVRVPWHWFVVEKKVDDRVAIQFERLLQELTSVLTTRYVEVPREGTAARFPARQRSRRARQATGRARRAAPRAWVHRRMRRGLIALLLLAAAPRWAAACPACASGQRTLNPLYFVLMVLPFVAAALAARVIVRALRAPDDH